MALFDMTRLVTKQAAGTWQAKPGEVGKAVGYALKSGYRHLDCALIYQNGELVFHSHAPSYAKAVVRLEKEVGDAIKASGIPRKEIFITSKVCVSHD